MKSLLTASLLTVALCAAGPALAQLATNSKAPVDVTGDHSEFTNSQCLSVWSGNVEALQDNARLRTDQLKIYLDRKAKPGSTAAGGACGDIQKIEAHGAVYYVTAERRVHGDDAIYGAASDILTVTGDVVAVQDKNVLRGRRMVFNQKTGEGHMVGAETGRNAPNRVRGVFYPNQSNASGKPAQPGPGQPR